MGARWPPCGHMDDDNRRGDGGRRMAQALLVLTAGSITAYSPSKRMERAFCDATLGGISASAPFGGRHYAGGAWWSHTPIPEGVSCSRVDFRGNTGIKYVFI